MIAIGSATGVSNLADFQAPVLGAGTDLKTKVNFGLSNQSDSLSSIPTGVVEMSGHLLLTREQGQECFLPCLFAIIDTI